ncbi:hypothetical protein [Flavobacterium daemonense]|uniref:hypothetical protein n=1 Tax=Flavobacterium daemonense TaxID=1393049 RepID=UPI0011859B65|nr:hypothetical protein [Flavobacterium daemonense]KAF2328559.1 hypothetical protein FND99_17390 [Flavobacterium daemonense]
MPKKKSIRRSIPLDQPNTKQKPKIIKFIIICIFICFGIYFIVWNSKQINLEGVWTPTKIVIDGKNFMTDNVLNDFEGANQIIINNWSNSIDISTFDIDTSAQFSIEKDNKDNTEIILTSKEKALNGDFEMKIDTIDLGPQEYLVKVELHSKKNYINFQKRVIVPPWKPEPPRRGQV